MFSNSEIPMFFICSIVNEHYMFIFHIRLIVNTQQKDVSHMKTWTWLRKRNLKRETRSLRTAAQNNAVRTNHIKPRIDKTQQNSRCWLGGARDETINHISECSKLTQKEYKTRHDWLGKVIHWELCKKLKFDHTNMRIRICATEYLSWWKRCTNSSGILR